jgi:hypothetical protein
LPASIGEKFMYRAGVEQYVLDFPHRKELGASAACSDYLVAKLLRLLICVEEERHRNGERGNRLGDRGKEAKRVFADAPAPRNKA